MRAAEQAAIDGGHQRREADGAGRGGAGRGRLSLRRADAGADPVRAGQQWRRRLCRGAAPAERGRRRCGSRRWPSRRATRRKWARAQWTARSRRCRRRPTPRAAADRLPVRNRPQARPGSMLSANSFHRLCDAAIVAVACDLPSGVESDSGAVLSAGAALRPDRDVRRAEARAPAVCRRCTNAGASCSPTSASRPTGDWHEIAPPDAAAARSRRPQIRPRAGPCAGRQDAGRDRACGDGRGAGRRGLCPGQHLAADRRPALGDRPDRHAPRSTTSASAACWSGPGMGDIPQVLTLALTVEGAQGDRRRRDRASSASPSGCAARTRSSRRTRASSRKLFGEIAGHQGRSGRSRRRGGRARWSSTRGRTRWSPRPTGGSASRRRRRRGWRAPGPATCSPG